jgi:hypothetical protein
MDLGLALCFPYLGLRLVDPHIAAKTLIQCQSCLNEVLGYPIIRVG